MAYKDRKKSNFGTCHYHLCRKRIDVHQCKYCSESFCSEHLKAKPPGFPRFSSTKPSDSLFMEEWHKKGGHPCVPYFNYWEQENKRKGDEYGQALDRILRRPKEHKVPENKPSNIIYRINYW